ncbi:MAG: sodium:solute symporter family protein [Clostridiales bacterium]|nr:sodium:solute symporter family protein [Clostridiales bacterium]
MSTIWVTIGVYVVAMVAVGLVVGRKSKNIADFSVGGRNAGAWISAMSYGTAYFSAVMFIGYAGGIGNSFGLWAILVGVGNAVFGTWLAWRVLARRTREVTQRLKIKTMPQFFEMRYQSHAMKIFACVVIFIFLIPYSASVYKGLSSVAQVLLGVSDTSSMVIIAVVSALLLVLGGYVVQARADFVQGIVMMVGVAFLILFVLRSKQVGGLSGIAAFAKTDLGLPELSSKKWTALLSLVLMTSFGTWGLPQMIQKYYGIRDDAQAKRGIAISTFFAVLVAGGGYFIGSLSHMFFDVDQIAAFPAPQQDYIVPNMLQAADLPAVLVGIVIVLLIAASVSTLSSITLTASSTLSMDFIKGLFHKKMSDKTVTRLTKILCVLFVILSYVVANTKTPILDMMSYSWGIISGSFLAPYVLALYWKGMNKIGAWAGMLTGFFLAMPPALCKLIATFANAPGAKVLEIAGKGPNYAVAAMVASIVVCLLVSLLAAKKTPEKEGAFFYTGLVAAE